MVPRLIPNCGAGVYGHDSGGDSGNDSGPKATEIRAASVILWREYRLADARGHMDNTLRQGVAIFLAIGGAIVVVLVVLAFYNS
jgi:hypothetical protein